MDLPAGYNWFLILVACVVGILCVVGNVYLLVHYQHPEDRNQAWFPKGVVIFGLSLSMLTVLLFPLDVANRAACSAAIVEGSCTLTLPMTQLWYAIFITNLALVFLIIPFTLFFYEGDSDYTLWMRIKTAMIWTFGLLCCLGLVVGIAYGLAGYVHYPTQKLTSGTLPINYLSTLPNITTVCIKPGQSIANYSGTNIFDNLCNAFGPTYYSSDFTSRCSFPVYVMAIQSVAGWILFMVFAGVGVMCAPIDWIFQYVGRPKSIITKSEYLARARGLAQRAKEIKQMAELLKRQQRDGGKDRRWRSNLKKLQREVVALEDDEYNLDAVYPQGHDGEVNWVMYQLGFILMGLAGVIGIGLSLTWIAHIIVYMLPVSPLNPMLNQVFVDLDAVFPLFGVAAFAGFCGYLMIVAIKGNFMLGMNFVFINLYPMRPGATMMSSFLFNEAIILSMSAAVIQFCAQAFGTYANNTEIFDIFGNQVMYLQGISWVYQFNFFLYCFICVAFLATIYMAIKGPNHWKGRKKADEKYVY